MLRIGEFSRLSMVPVSALRYYDEIGLLKPVSVDDFTGYRYYAAEQLARLNRITSLKDLGLSLAEIAELADDDTAIRVRPLLQRKLEEVRSGIAMEQERLRRIEAWLEHLRTTVQMDTTTYEVSIKRIAPQQAVCLRRVVSDYAAEGALWGELCSYLEQQKGIRYAGPALAIYYNCEYRERDVDLELAVPVALPVAAHGDIQTRMLPGHAQAATIIHKGPFEKVHDAYQFLLGWLERNGYRMDGPDRIVYLNTPDKVAPADLLKELQLPIARA